MNDDARKLKCLLENPDAPDAGEWVRALGEKYPYFPIARALELRSVYAGLDEADRQRLVEELTLSVPGSDAARRLADPAGDEFDNFYPPEAKPAKPSTDTTIDRFLETYGNESAEETATLEKLIFNPVPDYAQQLERDEAVPAEEDADSDSQLARINRFIRSQKQSAPDATVELQDEMEPAATEASAEVTAQAPAAIPQPAPERRPSAAATPENSLLSESLAKIYIKTHRYERAYEILSRLSLAVPEKNAYFADQLRFLRKVMLAESFRKQHSAASGNASSPQ